MEGLGSNEEPGRKGARTGDSGLRRPCLICTVLIQMLHNDDRVSMFYLQSSSFTETFVGGVDTVCEELCWFPHAWWMLVELCFALHLVGEGQARSAWMSPKHGLLWALWRENSN